MNSATYPYRLIAPGPVPVPAAVREAMAGPVLHHRTLQFEKILRETWSQLQTLFGTQQPVMILTGSGSAGMEAAVVNLVSPGEEVLVVVSGKFGERWANMCESFGASVIRLNVEWGHPVNLEEFSLTLKANPNLRAVFSEACETSTATLHPIEEMSRLIRKLTPKALFAVDAITAVGCMPLPMDEWELDVVVGGSQKAFMIPPGLTFVALSERAWAAQKRSRAPKYYFDLAAERQANEKFENHFTIPTPLVIGLHTMLKQTQTVGFEVVKRRCQILAQATRDAGAQLGLKTFSKAPSPSVTALEIAESAKVRDWLERERHITIMGGQDQLKNRILRIGHMGDVRDDDMLALFQALGEYLKIPFVDTDLRALLKTAPTLFA